jgi:hypothetical protein
MGGHLARRDASLDCYGGQHAGTPPGQGTPCGRARRWEQGSPFGAGSQTSMRRRLRVLGAFGSAKYIHLGRALKLRPGCTSHRSCKIGWRPSTVGLRHKNTSCCTSVASMPRSSASTHSEMAMEGWVGSWPTCYWCGTALLRGSSTRDRVRSTFVPSRAPTSRIRVLSRRCSQGRSGQLSTSTCFPRSLDRCAWCRLARWKPPACPARRYSAQPRGTA